MMERGGWQERPRDVPRDRWMDGVSQKGCDGGEENTWKRKHRDRNSREKTQG